MEILVADDDSRIQVLLGRVLESFHYQVLAALDGEEAVTLAWAANPDLVILDVEMPEKDGWQTLKELRADPRTGGVPVLMLTGQGGVEDRVLGLELGADDYLPKPFAVEELLARVRALLRKTRRDRAVHPMTGLPGSPAIEEEVSRRIREGGPFALLYVDIDGFKAYNDTYGYLRGDEAIRQTAEILSAALAPGGEPGDFLGHIGGDDFVILTDPRGAEELARKIAEEFDRRAPSLYSPEDRERGTVRSLDRLGRGREFRLMSLSIAIVTNERRTFGICAEVADAATEIKHYLKSQTDRRGSLWLK